MALSGNFKSMNANNESQNKLEKRRIILFAAVMVIVFGIYIGRLFTLQILDQQEWVAKAAENSIKEFNIPALRGIITDRNGTILARNQAAYNVVITAAELPDDEGATQQIFRQLSELIDVPVNLGEISEETPYVPCISEHGIAQIAGYGESSTPFTAVRVKCDIGEITARMVVEKAVDWPGVTIEITPVREYPTGSLTSTVVGFLGPIPANLEDYYLSKGLVPNRDKVGYAGVELQYQDALAGKNGLRVAEVDGAGKVVRADVIPPTPVESGLNLTLTLDTRLQQATTEILRDELLAWNRVVQEHKRMDVAVAIAMNPQTGEVLSMVSYPSYENSRMERFIPAYYVRQLENDPTKPLLNHAVGDVLPVGSVFKIVTGTGALNEGIVTPEQMIQTPGKLDVEEKYYANQVGATRPLVDWVYRDGLNPGGFGQLNFVGCMANSSNVCFYKLGGGYKDEIPDGGLGICRLGTYARALGYGDRPNIGLPEEQDGLVPDPRWKRINQYESWSSGDTYIASVGQGYVLGTPIQVLISASIIANNGKYMQPTLIREFTDADGNVVPRWLTPEGDVVDAPVEGARQVSPFLPHQVYDLTTDPVIQVYGPTTIRGCEPIEGEFKTVEPWVIEKVKEGMRMAVTVGTLKDQFAGTTISAAGKTGTGEYCDQYVAAKNLCNPGQWPTHAWTTGFAPYENPEIAVVGFVYNGGEGASVAGPIVRRVLEAYFTIKAGDLANQAP
jgi:penicillin-binding protein 2